ncbi:response regulator transcription factor [Luteitalea sp.]|uniref:LuxR C-terminal-related transcriptional regulator n=1 Tax=Luteitalea sp. TaxID=2004800 RepID=UPI0025C07D00|nr:response regulator transcription factor [Luteitalea sp.]
MRRSFKTVIVGPNALVREGLVHIFRGTDFRVVASTVSVEDAALNLLPEGQPALFVLESGHDAEATLNQIGILRARRTAGRVAVLANHYQPDDIVAAFRGGAHAYFVDVADWAAFTKSLELVMLGTTILPPEFLWAVLNSEEHEPDTLADEHTPDAGVRAVQLGGDETRLSAREGCILRHLVEGDSNKTIARKSNITEATVKVHIKAILRKIRVKNRTQAAIWAINNSASIRLAANDGAISHRAPRVTPSESMGPDLENGVPASLGELPQLGTAGHPAVIDFPTRKGAGRRAE